MKQALYVQIMGREYPIEAAPGEELYINRLAQFVEEKMTEARELTQTVDSHKLAVMAALNIADDFFRVQDERQQTVQLSESRLEGLDQALDKALAL